MSKSSMLMIARPCPMLIKPSRIPVWMIDLVLKGVNNWQWLSVFFPLAHLFLCQWISSINLGRKVQFLWDLNHDVGCFHQSHSDSLSFAIRMYAGTVVNPIRVARKRRSPEINWYLLKSSFLTVMGCITPFFNGSKFF
jgi:hypothetical protein